MASKFKPMSAEQIYKMRLELSEIKNLINNIASEKWFRTRYIQMQQIDEHHSRTHKSIDTTKRGAYCVERITEEENDLPRDLFAGWLHTGTSAVKPVWTDDVRETVRFRSQLEAEQFIQDNEGQLRHIAFADENAADDPNDYSFQFCEIPSKKKLAAMDREDDDDDDSDEDDEQEEEDQELWAIVAVPDSPNTGRTLYLRRHSLKCHGTHANWTPKISEAGNYTNDERKNAIRRGREECPKRYGINTIRV